MDVINKLKDILQIVKANPSLFNDGTADFLEELIDDYPLDAMIRWYDEVLHIDDHLKGTACYNCKWKSALTPSCYDSHIQGKKECKWHEDRRSN